MWTLGHRGRGGSWLACQIGRQGRGPAWRTSEGNRRAPTSPHRLGRLPLVDLCWVLRPVGFGSRARWWFVCACVGVEECLWAKWEGASTTSKCRCCWGGCQHHQQVQSGRVPAPPASATPASEECLRAKWEGASTSSKVGGCWCCWLLDGACMRRLCLCLPTMPACVCVRQREIVRGAESRRAQEPPRARIHVRKVLSAQGTGGDVSVCAHRMPAPASSQHSVPTSTGICCFSYTLC
jgi:hypothetical protein